MKLSKWTARRSGGHMTVSGLDEAGKQARITGVDRIGPTASGFGAAAVTRIVAVDQSGTQHELEA